ncbi:hypothetical protein P4305_21530 [Bacillus thuringiensis]|nr:hypothetical protein [Bacillus thuringiensis]MED3182554.1 hypothetical protein [Bacillus thuringiensis]OTY09887.1 hypothetical protein BK734_14060 [Bacillus thuringiensis serovar kim]OUB13712.1 hypothetical protein BK733_27705 [Bacillus thuringiensis serovar xiaguangiensis]
MRKHEKSYYIYQYTLLDMNTNSSKTGPMRSLTEEIYIFGVKAIDIFQFHMIKIKPIQLD